MLVWKLDRFGRSLRHLGGTLAELEAVGVAFVSLRDGFDLTTPKRSPDVRRCSSNGRIERD